jgi:type II secretory pathway component PulJ
MPKRATVSERLKALQALRAERFKDLQRHADVIEAEYQKMQKCKDEIDALDRSIKNASSRRGAQDGSAQPSRKRVSAGQ